jgi:hypothetical protein
MINLVRGFFELWCLKNENFDFVTPQLLNRGKFFMMRLSPVFFSASAPFFSTSLQKLPSAKIGANVSDLRVGV